MNQEREITTIDLIRHGEPLGGNRFRGNIDDPLSELGKKQMDAALGGECHWDLVVTSPMKRCCEYARNLAEKYGVELQVFNEFSEISFGEWEGKTENEIESADSGSVKSFKQDPVNNMPPGAENFIEYQQKVIPAWNRLVAENCGKRILLVGHGGFIRVVISNVLDIPLTNIFRIEMPLASLSRVMIEQIKDFSIPSLVFINGTL